jgi:hypothetical protein
MRVESNPMGHGAAMGIPEHTSPKRVFTWLWYAWVRAQKEVPLLRWLVVAAVAAACLVIYLAVNDGKTGLEMLVYGMVAALFIIEVPMVLYLLFEVYRKHRSDAIFDSKRLSDLIHKLAREEVEQAEEARLALENTLLMPEKGVKRAQSR